MTYAAVAALIAICALMLLRRHGRRIARKQSAWRLDDTRNTGPRAGND